MTRWALRRTAFVRGVTRAIDLRPARRRRLLLRDLGDDWQAVGDDLRAAMRRFDAEAAG